MTKANILIIDDELDILETARMFLKQFFTDVEICQDPAEINRRISSKSYDIILLDMNFRKGRNDGDEGFYWLQRIQEFDSSIIVLLITAYGEVELAVKAIKMGATDFILKPWKNQKLLGTILAALELRKSKVEVKKLLATQEHLTKSSFQRSDQFIGKDPSILRVLELVEKVSETDANVLILGENGTGKDLIASQIHNNSKRSDHVIIKSDLGAIPETLFESELFGHVKGAFTDAKSDRVGNFQLANGSTLFLDEIGNISLNQQAKILTSLENRTIRRLGSEKTEPLDIRLVSATNKPIYEMVKNGEFRQDLLYRINTVEITMPALRDRKDDIPLLVNHFLHEYSNKYDKPDTKITSKAMHSLKEYNWPGNVRELQHSVERAVILSDNGQITESQILLQPSGQPFSDTAVAPKTIDDAERAFIIKSLEENGGNVSKTARAIGLTRTAMYRRLKKYGI